MTGDPLELLLGTALRVDAYAALGASEGYPHQRALEGHERRERHHVVLGDVLAEADAALRGSAVVAMFRSERLDYFDGSMLHPDREPHTVHAVAVLDLVE